MLTKKQLYFFLINSVFPLLYLAHSVSILRTNTKQQGNRTACFTSRMTSHACGFRFPHCSFRVICAQGQNFNEQVNCAKRK